MNPRFRVENSGTCPRSGGIFSQQRRKFWRNQRFCLIFPVHWWAMHLHIAPRIDVIRRPPTTGRNS